MVLLAGWIGIPVTEALDYRSVLKRRPRRQQSLFGGTIEQRVGKIGESFMHVFFRNFVSGGRFGFGYRVGRERIC